MKSCFFIPLSLSLTFFFFFFNSFTTEAAPTYLYHDCPNPSLFTPSASYRSNLDTLFSSLISSATNTTNGFANATACQSPPDRAYGLFLCRGDLNSPTCSHCVTTAKRGILKRCPNRRFSIIWYDQCMLRYSNQPIISAMERLPNLTSYSSGNITDITRFMDLLGQILNNAATRASAGGSEKKVAAAEANFTSSQRLYALVQCTPDLTASDCVACLQIGIANLAEGKRGGRLLAASCNLRYELYPFYNASALPSPAPPPPAPVVGPEGTGTSNIAIGITLMVALLVGVSAVILVVACFGQWVVTKKNTVVREDQTQSTVVRGDQSGQIEMTIAASLQYDLATIRTATDNFSHQNKLGQGGFGEVFKGTLPDGQPIAVKQLSQGSEQGAEEFKNEVKLLVTLRHWNLARLLGFCSEDEEKLLVYEFEQNYSLDYVLFEDLSTEDTRISITIRANAKRSRQLKWSLRYKIACGIAQGIRYLHEEFPLPIIHRDIKASNILLDGEMNPKISDFGIARIFRNDQSWANTRKPVGTRGYMAPEYIMRGQFSIKSDVYSYWILLLELVIGKNSISIYQNEGKDIATYVWNNMRDGTPSAVLDPAVGETYSEDEVRSCLKMGLLCAQHDPDDRPTMADIFHKLTSRPVLELPHDPVFFLGRTESPVEELEPLEESD